MALGTVDELVKEKLSFVPATGWETKIESYRLQQCYFLQKWSGLSDTEVEDEANYVGLKKMLVSELVVYQMIIEKVITTTGGSSSTSTPGEGSGPRRRNREPRRWGSPTG